MLLQHNQHYYTKVEVTEILNISLAKINRALASKELGYLKIGKRSVRIPEQDLQKWIKRNEVVLQSVNQ
ncbi:helix-turn-helix domain-containing protein [Flavobacteriaceae bacterium]|jgi:excisionase family DNA binding protein|nr:helix-turn-helix domain-containing protein [Flavobacteriaceae bacterium]